MNTNGSASGTVMSEETVCKTKRTEKEDLGVHRAFSNSASPFAMMKKTRIKYIGAKREWTEPRALSGLSSASPVVPLLRSGATGKVYET